MTESIKLINFFGSIFTLTAMAIDRFILICKPKEWVWECKNFRILKKNVGKVLILYGKLQESLFFEIRKF